jgi:hypothetical protein
MSMNRHEVDRHHVSRLLGNRPPTGLARGLAVRVPRGGDGCRLLTAVKLIRHCVDNRTVSQSYVRHHVRHLDWPVVWLIASAGRQALAKEFRRNRNSGYHFMPMNRHEVDRHHFPPPQKSKRPVQRTRRLAHEKASDLTKQSSHHRGQVVGLRLHGNARLHQDLGACESCHLFRHVRVANGGFGGHGVLTANLQVLHGSLET